MPNTYTPDNWVVFKVPLGYKVLGGWSGGYTTGDSWRLNSGITRVEKEGDYYLFYGHSGSVYRCGVNQYGVRLNCSHVAAKLEEKGAIYLEEDTDWEGLKYG